MHRVCAPFTYSHARLPYAIRIFLPVDMWRLSSAMINSHCWFTSKNWLTASDTIQSKCIMQFIVLQLVENFFFSFRKWKIFSHDKFSPDTFESSKTIPPTSILWPYPVWPILYAAIGNCWVGAGRLETDTRDDFIFLSDNVDLGTSFRASSAVFLHKMLVHCFSLLQRKADIRLKERLNADLTKEPSSKPQLIGLHQKNASLPTFYTSLMALLQRVFLRLFLQTLRKVGNDLRHFFHIYISVIFTWCYLLQHTMQNHIMA